MEPARYLSLVQASGEKLVNFLRFQACSGRPAQGFTFGFGVRQAGAVR